jgi:hypothetical protein
VPVLSELRETCGEIRLMGDRLHLKLRTPAQMELLFSLVSARRLELISINPIRPSLEEYFQSIVGGPQSAASSEQGMS